MKSVPDVCEMIRTGSNDQLEGALRDNPGLAGEKTDQGISLLTYAAYCRNKTAVQAIRQRKSHIDIFEAASIGDFPVVKTLLQQHPDQLNAYSTDGFTPLGLSCFFGHEEIAKYLTESGADVNQASKNAFKVAPLHSACAISHYTIAEILLRHGARTNLAQQSGVTPLHEAAHNGQTRLVQLLIEHGADVNAKMDNGNTPLAMAEEKSYTETATLLRKHGGM